MSSHTHKAQESLCRKSLQHQLVETVQSNPHADSIDAVFQLAQILEESLKGPDGIYELLATSHTFDDWAGNETLKNYRGAKTPDGVEQCLHSTTESITQAPAKKSEKSQVY